MDNPFVAPSSPQSTASLWGDLFGIGAVMRMANDMAADPKIKGAMMDMIMSVANAAFALTRIEAKLDTLLKDLGHDPEKAGQSANGRTIPAALLADFRNLGPGGHPVASVIADNGGRIAKDQSGPFGAGAASHWFGGSTPGDDGSVKNA